MTLAVSIVHSLFIKEARSNISKEYVSIRKQKKQKQFVAGILVLLVVFKVLTAQVIAASNNSVTKDLATSHTFSLTKLSIGVSPLKNKVAGFSGNEQMQYQLAEVFAGILAGSGYYNVSISDSEKTHEISKIHPPQYRLETTITEFNGKASNRGFVLEYSIASVEQRKQKAHVGLDVKIVDTLSGEVMASHQTVATATNRTLSSRIAKEINFMGKELKYKREFVFFSDSPLGKASLLAVENAAEFVIDAFENLPWQASFSRINPKLHINQGENVSLTENMILKVLSTSKPLYDEELGITISGSENYLCDIKIEKVMPTYSIARAESSCNGINFSLDNILRLK